VGSETERRQRVFGVVDEEANKKWMWFDAAHAESVDEPG